MLISRDLPNSVGGPQDIYNSKIIILHYYDEDVELMKNMSREEQIEYKRMLRQQKRYWIEDNDEKIITDE